MTGREIRTHAATLTWSGDGSSVTKRLARTGRNAVLGSDAARFRNEVRGNRMLERSQPPVRRPRMLTVGERGTAMTFEAVAGEQVGEKYPVALEPVVLTGMVGMARVMGSFDPRRRWLRRFRAERRLRIHVADGDLSGSAAAALRHLLQGRAGRLRFAHGDITARNVISTPAGLWLVDWEHAGLYPQAWDLAMLWFTLVDVPGGRAAAEAAVPPHAELPFRLSLAFVHLLHLHLWPGRTNPFVARHRATLRDELAELTGVGPG